MGNKILGKCSSALDVLLSTAAAFSGITIVFLIISVCYDVVSRYFFHRSHSWVTEVGGFIMLSLPFLSTGWVLKKNTHIRMDMFYEKLSTRNKAILDVFTNFISIIVCAILVWRGAGVVEDLIKSHTRTNTTLMVAEWPFMAVIPFGFILLLLEYVRKFLQSLYQLTTDKKNENTDHR